MAWITAFAAAFGLVEASVVIYLRALYYPGGFAFPLIPMPATHLAVELVREAATIIMLIAVGVLAGSRGWERFGFFLAGFGLWDLFFYLWLRVAIGWPKSPGEWDILFLIPLPWIGPVYSPVTVAVLMVIIGTATARRVGLGQTFHPRTVSWLLGIVSTGVILFSYMIDTRATLHEALPRPYHVELLIAGVAGYVGAYVAACRGASPAR
jgi:hypothetical protein